MSLSKYFYGSQVSLDCRCMPGEYKFSNPDETKIDTPFDENTYQ